MDLTLHFHGGNLLGIGLDNVGQFSIEGTYNELTGTCAFLKKYVGRHSVDYRGSGSEKSIDGQWTISKWFLSISGNFSIWPVDSEELERRTEQEETISKKRVEELVTK